jgi:ABC-type sugar transport system substrate-binding protein
MKKYLFPVLLVLVLLLAACGATEPEVQTVEKEVTRVVEVAPEEPTVCLSIFNFQHPVVRTMYLGFEMACEDYGLSCADYMVQEPDTDAYVSRIEQLAAMDCDAAVIYNDSDALVAAATMLTEQIPTVSFHTPFAEGESPNTAWVSANTAEYGYDAGVRLGEAMGGVGVVATSMSSAASATESVVLEHFTRAMSERYPDIVVLDPVYETTEFNQATSKASATFVADPEITAVFSTTGGGAKAWSTAARDTGHLPGEILVVGMDYTEENLKLILAGDVYAVVGQPLVEEVYLATKLAYNISKGAIVDEQNYLPCPWVTATNADLYMQWAEEAMKD